MKNVIIEKTYYDIDELKEINISGYNTAYYDYVSLQEEYNYNYDSLQTINKFLHLFDCTLEYMIYNSVYLDDFSFTNASAWLYNEETDEDELLDLDEIEGEKIKDYIEIKGLYNIIKGYQNCNLTGYCLDCVVLEPLYECLFEEKHQNNTLYDLIHEGLSRALKIIDDDFDYQCSEEAFEEYCWGENLMFDIDGNKEDVYY